MNDTIFAVMKKYGEILSNSEELTGPVKIYLRVGKTVYTHRNLADLKNLLPNDIIISKDEFENYILNKSDKYSSLIISDTEYLHDYRELDKSLEATLDDMAQIVGRNVKCTDYNCKKISKLLRKSSACMVRKKYNITAGRTLYEAITALKVAEKSAEVNLKAEKIGGAKKIPRSEAAIMRWMYQKKYSKGEVTWKKENEK